MCFYYQLEWTWERWQSSSIIKLFGVISRTLIGGVLALCRNAVGVFCSPSWLDHVPSGHWQSASGKKKKARWEPYKDVAYCFEQFLEATPHKTTIQSPKSYLTNYQSKMDKTCWTLLEEDKQTHKQCSPVNSLVLADRQKLTFHSSVWMLDAV